MIVSQLDVVMKQEYYQDLRREAERDRLVQEALKAKPPSQPWNGRALSWLGSHMVSWGQGLQTRYDAPAPLIAHSRSRLLSE